ncbi:MAG: PEP-CTERM sorting domain-containing protein [Phycisphaerae bacterium]
MAGSLALNGEMAIILGAGYDPAEGDTWEVITGLSNTTGGFLTTAVYRQGEAEPFAYCDAGESDGALVIGNIQEIPEPTTLALLLTAAGTFAGRRRRRRRLKALV